MHKDGLIRIIPQKGLEPNAFSEFFLTFFSCSLTWFLKNLYIMHAMKYTQFGEILLKEHSYFELPQVFTRYFYNFPNTIEEFIMSKSQL